MIATKLNEAVKRQGVTLYWVARNSGIPYPTLWTICQKENAGETQESINLSVLSRLCTVLECTPNDLLHYKVSDEDKALLMLIKTRGAKKAAKEKGRKK